MDVTLPADLTRQVEQELATGRYRSRDELIEQGNSERHRARIRSKLSAASL
jgi:Arc/MetJ-type ribon-helix-helix transcriptional regulator